jgi:hypothetical protein
METYHFNASNSNRKAQKLNDLSKDDIKVEQDEKRAPESKKTDSIKYFKFVEVEIEMNLKSLANQSEHWTAKSKRNRGQANAVYYALCNRLNDLKPPYLITLTRVAPRTLDGDNLVISFKKIRDEISHMFFPDTRPGMADSYDCFIWKYKQEKAKPKEYAIKIRIDELEKDHVLRSELYE